MLIVELSPILDVSIVFVNTSPEFHIPVLSDKPCEKMTILCVTIQGLDFSDRLKRRLSPFGIPGNL